MIRIGLVSARPVPPALLDHARELLSAVAADVATSDTSRPGWSGVSVAGVARPGAAANVDLALTAELRGPATALGVNVAVTAGPLAADGVGLLVMDVDSTLITAEVIELLAEHAGTREQVAEVTERAMRGELDFAASLRERVATLAGLDAGVVDTVRAAVELSAGARELVAAVHERGGKVALVSGGFLEVVGPIAEELGIDHLTANRLEVEDGRLTGRTAGPVVDRAAKERHLRAWAAEDGVPLERVVAVGDGANDLDMLGAAGLGVAYCAKPVVQEQARAAVTFPRLDAVLGLLGG
ncbi:phosphoserine phosphatase SerB [Georgenia satyanarayanai]|uniref:phosphoserine phosphatase SerB n=1 Tax=Georgenia satyanarayanai TaxID=860221 RepID=UPI00203CBA20|nr:phosphoserine phosphatase SerB [Georgenia satyanarayanai]MCM3662042.1 phosphoserine phosphatase SerB [Georgenia satyanarayanai]